MERQSGHSTTTCSANTPARSSSDDALGLPSKIPSTSTMEDHLYPPVIKSRRRLNISYVCEGGSLVAKMSRETICMFLGEELPLVDNTAALLGSWESNRNRRRRVGWVQGRGERWKLTRREVLKRSFHRVGEIALKMSHCRCYPMESSFQGSVAFLTLDHGAVLHRPRLTYPFQPEGPDELARISAVGGLVKYQDSIDKSYSQSSYVRSWHSCRGCPN